MISLTSHEYKIFNIVPYYYFNVRLSLGLGVRVQDFHEFRYPIDVWIWNFGGLEQTKFLVFLFRLVTLVTDHESMTSEPHKSMFRLHF